MFEGVKLATEQLTQPSTDRPFIDESGALSVQARTWVSTITNQATIVGDGTPEGFVEAPIAQRYMDRLGAPGSTQYIKRDADILGDKSKGWSL